MVIYGNGSLKSLVYLGKRCYRAVYPSIRWEQTETA